MSMYSSHTALTQETIIRHVEGTEFQAIDTANGHLAGLDLDDAYDWEIFDDDDWALIEQDDDEDEEESGEEPGKRPWPVDIDPREFDLDPASYEDEFEYLDDDAD